MDILQNDERQVGSYHIVTTSTHSTILQYLLWEHCVRRLAKCKSVRFAKEKYRFCPKVITDFCGHFVFDFPLAYHWVGLKPLGILPLSFLNSLTRELVFVRGHIEI